MILKTLNAVRSQNKIGKLLKVSILHDFTSCQRLSLNTDENIVATPSLPLTLITALHYITTTLLKAKLFSDTENYLPVDTGLPL